MSIVNVTIRDNTYQIACDDGQEAHLQHVVGSLNKRLSVLASSLGKGSDNLLLVMVGLMMEDEIAELKHAQGQPRAYNAHQDKPVDADAAVTQAVDAIAEYIETIAKNIEKP